MGCLQNGCADSRALITRIAGCAAISDPLFPVSRSPAGVSDGHDLDSSAGPLPINQKERKLSQQEPAGTVRTVYPALRSPHNFDQRTIEFRVEFEGRAWAALQIPIKRRIIFGGGFLVQFHRPSGHEAASLNCAGGLPSKARFLPCPNRVR
jgi:hypothetical protein